MPKLYRTSCQDICFYWTTTETWASHSSESKQISRFLSCWCGWFVRQTGCRCSTCGTQTRSSGWMVSGLACRPKYSWGCWECQWFLAHFWSFKSKWIEYLSRIYMNKKKEKQPFKDSTTSLVLAFSITPRQPGTRGTIKHQRWRWNILVSHIVQLFWEGKITLRVLVLSTVETFWLIFELAEPVMKT